MKSSVLGSFPCIISLDVDENVCCNAGRILVKADATNSHSHLSFSEIVNPHKLMTEFSLFIVFPKHTQVHNSHTDDK